MTDVIPATDAEFDEFLAAANDQSVELTADQISEQIIRRILSSTTADEILGGAGTTPARDVLDVPFTLVDLHLNKSGIDGGALGMYAVLDGVNADGEKLAITCGASNVMAQAYQLRKIGALPVDVVIRQSDKPTANGYHVMWLDKPGASF
jgi:hypothetical protein